MYYQDSQPFARTAKGFSFPRHSSHRSLTRLTLRVPIAIPSLSSLRLLSGVLNRPWANQGLFNCKAMGGRAEYPANTLFAALEQNPSGGTEGFCFIMFPKQKLPIGLRRRTPAVYTHTSRRRRYFAGDRLSSQSIIPAR